MVIEKEFDMLRHQKRVTSDAKEGEMR